MADEFVDAQHEPGPDRQIIGDYKKAIDVLRYNLFGKETYSDEELAQSEAMLRENVGTMLDFFHTDSAPQKDVVSNLQATLLFAHFGDRTDLKMAVLNGVVGNLDEMTSALNVDSEGNMLSILNNIINLSDQTSAERIQHALSEKPELLERFFGGERTLDVANVCWNLASMKFSPRARQFSELLKSHADDLVSLIEPSNLLKSRDSIELLRYAFGESQEGRGKLRQIFFENADTLLEGIRTGSIDFSTELSNALKAEVGAEEKIGLLNKLNAITDENPDSKQLVIELLVSDFNDGVEEPDGPELRTLEILNSNPEIVWNCSKDTMNLFKLARFARYCTDQNRDFIFEQINQTLTAEHDPEKMSKHFAFLMDSCGVRVGNTRKAMELYGRHLDIVQNAIFDPYIAQRLSQVKKSIYVGIVNQLASFGEKDQAAPALEMVYHLLDFDPKQFFKEYDMNEEEYVEAWRRGMGDVVENFRLNRVAVERIAQERGKEAIHALSREFGIKNFDRYPIELLLKQYDEKDDIHTKYGIILYPEFDHGTAFTSDEDRQMMASLDEQLQDKYKIRIGEVGSRFELAKRLSILHKKYGKASFGVMGAHGAEEMMQLGFGSERRELSVADLEGAAAERIGDYFEDGSTIILESCSTGADKGIAEKLSSVFGKRVIAPTQIAGGIKSIVVNITEDMPPRFEVDFYYSVGREYEKGIVEGERNVVEDNW